MRENGENKDVSIEYNRDSSVTSYTAEQRQKFCLWVDRQRHRQIHCIGHAMSCNVF